MSAETVIEFARPAQLMNMNDREHWRVQRRTAQAWRVVADVQRVGAQRRVVGAGVDGDRQQPVGAHA